MHRTTIMVGGTSGDVLGGLSHADRGVFVSHLIEHLPAPALHYDHDADDLARVQINISDTAHQKLIKMPQRTMSAWIRDYITSAWLSALQCVGDLVEALHDPKAAVCAWRVVDRYRPTTFHAVGSACMLAYNEPTFDKDAADQVYLRRIGATSKALHVVLHLHAAAPLRQVFELALAAHLENARRTP